MSRLLCAVTLIFSSFIFTACPPISPEYATSMRSYAQAEYEAGRLTETQYNAVLIAIGELESGVTWEDVLEVLSLAGGTILAGLFGMSKLPSRTGLSKEDATELKKLISKG